MRTHEPVVQNAARLILQWHITERCNLRCVHCYQQDYSDESCDDLLTVVEQFEELLDEVSRQWAPLPTRGLVTVTGGEPLLHNGLLDLLEVLSTKRPRLTFALLTNGTRIDEPFVDRLGALDPAFVQVSIEGDRDTNDLIRGPGTYDRAIDAIRHLVRARVPTALSFTAHKENADEFGAVARLGRELGVDLVWADRVIPLGSASILPLNGFTPAETRRFFQTMVEARAQAGRSFCQTEIGVHRALQFLVGGGRPYRCVAGDTLIAVQPNGDLYPCRRMPIPVGNLFKDSLSELYFESDLLRALRDRDRIATGCEDCRYANLCGGGLRCLAFALTGDPFSADPGCWHAHSPTMTGEHVSEAPLGTAGTQGDVGLKPTLAKHERSRLRSPTMQTLRGGSL
jgi:radical SAM protein with 4Fe4S-binding SPASM domain